MSCLQFFRSITITIVFFFYWRIRNMSKFTVWSLRVSVCFHYFFSLLVWAVCNFFRSIRVTIVLFFLFKFRFFFILLFNVYGLVCSFLFCFLQIRAVCNFFKIWKHFFFNYYYWFHKTIRFKWFVLSLFYISINYFLSITTQYII